MSQRNRSGRGPHRHNGASPGEEAQLWESAKIKCAELVVSVNADNVNLDELLEADRSAARAHREHAGRVPPLDLDTLEDRCRIGVRMSEANSNLIKSLIEQLTVLRGVQFAKEAAADPLPAPLTPIPAPAAATVPTPAPVALPPPAAVPAAPAATPTPAGPISSSSSRAGGGPRASTRDRESTSLYDIDPKVESPAPSPISSVFRGRTGDRVALRDSVPPKAASVEPPPSAVTTTAPPSTVAATTTPSAAAAPAPAPATRSTSPTAAPAVVAAAASAAAVTVGAGSTAGTPGPGPAGAGLRTRVTFTKGEEVAFRPRAPNGEPASDWILGEVAQVMGEGKSRRYKVIDVDSDDPAGQKEYRSSASSMIAIAPPGPATDALPPWESGKVVLALYPHTTTFYEAKVVGAAPDGKVNLRFEGENDSRTTTLVERRFVIEFRS